MFSTLVPSAFITWMSGLPSRLLWKATRVPSGDQVGKVSRLAPGAALSVRLTSPEPSAFIL